MPVLGSILAETRARVVALQERAGDLAARAMAAPFGKPFLKSPGTSVGVIAEVKRRSPSQGDIRPDLDPVRLAQAYERGGAQAVSVLTEKAHFGGSLEDLKRVAATIGLPVLRKDFILNEVQVLEARAAGASAVLLIARIVQPNQLEGLARIVRYWEMTPLIEVHDVNELDAALAASPEVIGVNARDLDTLAMDPKRAEAMIHRIPSGVTVVAESGIESHADVERVAAAGADYVLVGTSVARHDNPEQAVRALKGVKRKPR